MKLIAIVVIFAQFNFGEWAWDTIKEIPIIGGLAQTIDDVTSIVQGTDFGNPFDDIDYDPDNETFSYKGTDIIPEENIIVAGTFWSYVAFFRTDMGYLFGPLTPLAQDFMFYFAAILLLWTVKYLIHGAILGWSMLQFLARWFIRLIELIPGF